MLVALIPARSGSKGIKGKNIFPVNGKPLMQYTIKFALSVKEINDVFVSTDSEQVASIARSLGANVPFLRPKAISRDNSSDIDYLFHFLTEYEKKYRKKISTVITMQPTSPIRSSSDLTNAIKLNYSKDIQSIWSISKVDKKFHPMKQLQIDNIGNLNLYEKKYKYIRRQDLKDTYIRNGVFYFHKREAILNKDWMPKGTVGYEIEHSVNIDSIVDIEDFKNYIELNK